MRNHTRRESPERTGSPRGIGTGSCQSNTGTIGPGQCIGDGVCNSNATTIGP